MSELFCASSKVKRVRVCVLEYSYLLTQSLGYFSLANKCFKGYLCCIPSETYTQCSGLQCGQPDLIAHSE